MLLTASRYQNDSNDDSVQMSYSAGIRMSSRTAPCRRRHRLNACLGAFFLVSSSMLAVLAAMSYERMFLNYPSIMISSCERMFLNYQSITISSSAFYLQTLLSSSFGLMEAARRSLAGEQSCRRASCCAHRAAYILQIISGHRTVYINSINLQKMYRRHNQNQLPQSERLSSSELILMYSSEGWFPSQLSFPPSIPDIAMRILEQNDFYLFACFLALLALLAAFSFLTLNFSIRTKARQEGARRSNNSAAYL